MRWTEFKIIKPLLHKAIDYVIYGAIIFGLLINAIIYFTPAHNDKHSQKVLNELLEIRTVLEEIRSVN